MRRALSGLLIVGSTLVGWACNDKAADETPPAKAEVTAKQDAPAKADAKQDDAKQDDAKQDDAKQDDAKQDDAEQDDAKQDDAKQDDAEQDDAKQDEPDEPTKIGDGKSPVPDPDGEYPAETYDLDGRKTPDTSAERNTEKDQGWTPVASRLPSKRIEVSTVRELISALGSDRTIVVKPGVYVWRDGDVLGYAKPAESYDKLSKHWRDGTIVDVENLAIVGEGTGPRILQPDSYDHVLSFQDVEGLTLYNLVLGHHVDRGWCAGGVLRIIGGRDLVLDGLEMFGSGTEGLTMTHVEDVEVRKSVVWGCSEQLSTLFYGKNVTITDTIFRDNGPELLRGFNLAHTDLKLERVTIENNLCGSAMAGYGTLFSDGSGYPALPGVADHGEPKIKVKAAKDVSVEVVGGKIVDNKFDRLADRPGAVTVTGSTVERSGW